MARPPEWLEPSAAAPLSSPSEARAACRWKKPKACGNAPAPHLPEPPRVGTPAPGSAERFLRQPSLVGWVGPNPPGVASATARTGRNPDESRTNAPDSP